MQIDDFPELPNGLHDAVLLRLSLDLSTREVRLELDAWVGDLGDSEYERRETRLICTVIVSGVVHFAIEPPDPSYPSEEGSGMIDCGLGIGRTDGPVPNLPTEASLHWIYLSKWNSFIHLAGTGASLEVAGKQ